MARVGKTIMPLNDNMFLYQGEAFLIHQPFYLCNTILEKKKLK
jgi:hypothetical protein